MCWLTWHFKGGMKWLVVELNASVTISNPRKSLMRHPTRPNDAGLMMVMCMYERGNRGTAGRVKDTKKKKKLEWGWKEDKEQRWAERKISALTFVPGCNKCSPTRDNPGALTLPTDYSGWEWRSENTVNSVIYRPLGFHIHLSLQWHPYQRFLPPLPVTDML